MKLHGYAKLGVKDREPMVERIEVAWWSLTQAEAGESMITQRASRSTALAG